MNPETLAEMKAAAEAAYVGQWMLGKPGGPQGPFWIVLTEKGWIVAPQVEGEQNAAHIAVASPANVLALIADYERLEAALEELEKQISSHPSGFPPSLSDQMIIDIARAALAGEPS